MENDQSGSTHDQRRTCMENACPSSDIITHLSSFAKLLLESGTHPLIRTDVIDKPIKHLYMHHNSINVEKFITGALLFVILMPTKPHI